MDLVELAQKIESKSSLLAVIGLGYVGLTVACEFARVGFDVVGIDIDPDKVARINLGTSPIEGSEPGLAELLAEVINTGKLRAKINYHELTNRDVVLIAVETPVDELHIPHYKALISALNSLGPVLKSGALVIIESTIAPGTMKNIVLPVLTESTGQQLNHDFYLGNCPERVMPGKLLHNLRQISRVIGGMNPETAEVMKCLYRQIVQADLDITDCTTAELVKTVENAYRDVQIAFANEVAKICEIVGGDVWKVRELVNKSPNRQMHLPGAGVGGHCIPKDPWLLASAVLNTGMPLKVIPAARQVNDSMPGHIANLLQSAFDEIDAPIIGANILVMGYAYLEESDDIRNSPSKDFVEIIQAMGAHALIHDPFVPKFQGNLLQLAGACDAAVLMVSHQIYRGIDLSALRSALRLPIMIDGRGVHHQDKLASAGFHYRIIGHTAIAEDLH